MSTVTVISRRACSSDCLAAHWLMVNQDGNVRHGRVTRAVQMTDGCSREIGCGKGASASVSQLRRERLAMRFSSGRLPATVRMGWGPGQVYSPDGPVINRTQLKHGT
jgi:hypothetical protein